MQTIQVVLDEALLRAADEAARQVQVNRSAFIREALREHLRRMQIRQLEQRDREGYETHPDTLDELQGWEEVAAWPED